MAASFKKILLVLVTLLLGVMNGGVFAQTVSYVTGSDNEYKYTAAGGAITYYDLSVTGYNSSFISTPWWGSKDTATLFATAVGGNLGYPNTGWSPLFQYGSTAEVAINSSGTIGGNPSFAPTAGWTYTTATLHAGAPEIDGSLAPKVGFLLGCLFLMFGRKKQNTEALLTA